MQNADIHRSKVVTVALITYVPCASKKLQLKVKLLF